MARPVLDVFKDKLVKRKVSLKALDVGEPRPSGKLFKISATLQDGLTQEQAKKITKVIRDEGPKGVKTQVQGEEVRVSSKKKDDLQAVMTLLTSRTLTSPCSSPTGVDAFPAEAVTGPAVEAEPRTARSLGRAEPRAAKRPQPL